MQLSIRFTVHGAKQHTLFDQNPVSFLRHLQTSKIDG